MSYTRGSLHRTVPPGASDNAMAAAEGPSRVSDLGDGVGGGVEAEAPLLEAQSARGGDGAQSQLHSQSTSRPPKISHCRP